MPTDLQEIAMALHSVANAIREAAPKPSSDPRELGESYARGYAAGADEMRRTAARSIAKLMAYHLSGCVCDLCKETRSMWPADSKPGPHVVGGPVPKPGEKTEEPRGPQFYAEIGPKGGQKVRELMGLVSGGPVPHPNERTEADYLREEVRDLKAELAAMRPRLKCDCCLQTPCACTVKCQCRAPEAAPPAQEEAAAEAVMADPHNLMACYTQADMDAALAEARATARREAIEEAEAAIEVWWRKAMVLKLQHLHDVQAAIRALAPVAQGGEEDAR